jgi:hypothetical protein
MAKASQSSEEVTPEMVEAGVCALVGFDWVHNDTEDAVLRVYAAMRSKARTSEMPASTSRRL